MFYALIFIIALLFFVAWCFLANHNEHYRIVDIKDKEINQLNEQILKNKNYTRIQSFKIGRLIEHVKLPDGHIICHKCSGTKEIPRDSLYFIGKPCNMCKGNGSFSKDEYNKLLDSRGIVKLVKDFMNFD